MMVAHRYSRLPLVIALAAMTMVSSAVAQDGSNDRSTPAASTAQIDRQGELLKKAAREVHLEVEKNWNKYLGGSGGFNSIGFTQDAVIVHWKGEVPANVTRAIAKARRIAPVRVQAADFSRIELKGAARRIGNYIDTAAAESSIHSIWVVNNNSLRVEVTPGYDTFAAKAVLPEVNVPVEVTEGEPIQVTSRSEDAAPWKGGAFFRAVRNGQDRAGCTTGFGVYQSGRKYMLTAAHCATAPDWIVTPSGNGLIGFATTTESWLHDLILIDSPNAGRDIYDGGVGSGEFTKRVVDFDYVWGSDLLCTSGARTGVVCNIKPTGDWAARVRGCDSDGDCYIMEDMILADRLDGNRASQPGDSGGPVFAPRPDGLTVIAKGTITGIVTSKPNRLVFQDFVTAYRDFQIVPIT